MLPINSILGRHYDVKLPHFTNKLYVDVGNGEYIILCNIGGCIMSVFEVLEGCLLRFPPGHRKQIKGSV